MQCFYHTEQSARGICKYCGRGLCPECISEVNDSLACKNRHEEQVAGLNLLNNRNLLQAQRVGSNYLRNAIFYFLSGALFSGFGIYQVKWAGMSGLFLLFIGLFLLYAAVANFLESRKY